MPLLQLLWLSKSDFTKYFYGIESSVLFVCNPVEVMQKTLNLKRVLFI